MKNTKEIEIYLVDNDPLFLMEFYENFAYDHKYKITTESSVQNFLSKLRSQKNDNYTIVIINDMIISRGLNTKSVVDILKIIKNIDKEISVIVLTDSDNRELKLSSSDLRPDAFVKNDKMLYFKLPPTLNRIVSKYEVKKNKFQLRIVFIIAAIVIAITIIHIVIATIIS